MGPNTEVTTLAKVNVMSQHATARFENGHLTPLTPLHGIPEHALVEILVQAVTAPDADEQLALLRNVPVAPELADAIEAGREQKWKVEES
jgi:hypothetical protein